MYARRLSWAKAFGVRSPCGSAIPMNHWEGRDRRYGRPTARGSVGLAWSTLMVPKPADSVLNTEAGKGALRPPVTPWVAAPLSARWRAGAASATSVPVRPDGCPPTAGPDKATSPDQWVSLRRVERLGPGRLVGRRVAAAKMPRGGPKRTRGRPRPAHSERQRGRCWGSKGQAPRQPLCTHKG